MSTAYHPETNGQTEIVNKTIKQYLRATIHNNPKGWVELLPWAELWYNSSFHHSLGTSPFQTVYAWPAPEIIDYRTGSSNVEAVVVLLQQRDNMLHELHNNLLAAQNQMKKYADLRRRPFEFKEEE